MKEEDNIKRVICINTDILAESGHKPEVVLDKVYNVLEEFTCKCGQIHYDIGLKTKLNFITCYKCKEELPIKEDIHWCNSIRFK